MVVTFPSREAQGAGEENTSVILHRLFAQTFCPHLNISLQSAEPGTIPSREPASLPAALPR
jgi:hypothetical protein